MKKQKHSDIIKVAVLSLFAIGLFSLAFYAVNNWSFARVVDEPVTVAAVTPAEPITPAEVETPPAEALSAEVPPPKTFDITVSLDPLSFRTSDAAIPMEEAAQIGAQYIWDVFGEDISGKTVTMQYGAWVHTIRAHWIGNVHEPEVPGTNFFFVIDAFTGERIDIEDRNEPPPLSGGEALKWRLEEGAFAWEPVYVHDASVYVRSLVDPVVFPTFDPTPEQLEIFTEMAKDFAQRHFNDTRVVSAELSTYGFQIGPDANENLLAVPSLWFTVLDETGREATVWLCGATNRLKSINTSANDIIPGFFDGGVG